MLDELLTGLAARGRSTAVHFGPGADRVTAGRLVREVCAAATGIAGARAAGTPDGSAWVATADRYRFVVAALGALAAGPVALVDAQGPAESFDVLAAGSPPALVVTDSAALDVAGWARRRGVPVHVVDPGGGGAMPGPVAAAPVQFFSSGTTGPMKCVTVGPAQLAAAVHGVANRLRLSEEDVSLALAPLTHTLGFVTTVLAALASGGAVALADPMRSREVLDAVRTAGPTWCAASPSLHLLVHRLARGAGLTWPRLRFLRASAAPMRDDAADELERYYGVPLVNAYAMTEAPGEIASQDLGARTPGTVGRPTLCEVRLRPVEGSPLPDGGGEIWIRGPNVVSAGLPGSGGWRATADLGVLEPDGQLRLTGRLHDVINAGGLKVWPREVETVALRHGDVGTAVAFPVRDAAMGEKVGLAVVARPGRSVDRATVRRALMGALPREKWPGVIVVCDRIPQTARGKIDRRNLARLLHVDAS